MYTTRHLCFKVSSKQDRGERKISNHNTDIDEEFHYTDNMCTKQQCITGKGSFFPASKKCKYQEISISMFLNNQ